MCEVYMSVALENRICIYTVWFIYLEKNCEIWALKETEVGKQELNN